jgi:indolepyruvate ferredoxin oxidoreductase alpha subunit
MATLIQMGKEYGFYTEWSTNEKVASEVAIAASLSGLRSMVSMKGVGVNVAAEPFQAYTYMGVEGGIVMVAADDPTPHSSHNEQDNRLFAREAYMPVLEPCNGKEARDMASAVFQYSERWGQPIMLRSNTMIGHSRSDITLKKIPKTRRKAKFVRRPKRWVNLPMNARVLRRNMIMRMEKIVEAAERLPFTFTEGPRSASTGIITSGISYVYVKEALDLLGMGDMIRILKLGMPYPIPKKKIARFLSNAQRVLVVEELEPFVEQQVAALANKERIDVVVEGKEHTGLAGEMTPRRALNSLCKFLGTTRPYDSKRILNIDEKSRKFSAPRPPVLCPGCAERVGFFAMNIVEKSMMEESGEFVRPTDIGCYTIGYMPPLKAVDTNFCMGGGIGLGVGLAQVIKNPIIATIGDSTFFHAGLPPMVNAVFNNADVTLLLFDNGTTAMTGHQPHPGTGENAVGEETNKIDIEGMVRAMGVQCVKVVNGYNLGQMVRALEEAVRFKGPAVVIARAPCRLLQLREWRKTGREVVIYGIDRSVCKQCGDCINYFGCPAMHWDKKEVAIDPTLCSGCGVCATKFVCAEGAIKPLKKIEAARGGGGR